MFDEFERDKLVTSLFSEGSALCAGLNWVLKDLLNKDESVGSACLEADGAPAKAAGWKSRFGIWSDTRERT